MSVQVPKSSTPTAELRVDAGDRTSCGYHRLGLPYADRGFYHPKVPVFVFSRLPTIGEAETLHLKRRGWRLVMDIDDYWYLPRDHYLASAYRMNRTPERTEWLIRNADAVTVTHAKLAYEVGKFNRNVVVVPNALPFDEGQFCRGEQPMDRARFVYAAGISHRPDMLMIREALNRPDVTLAGHVPGNREWEMVAHAIPNAQRAVAKPLHKYMHLYHGHNVSLAPLAANQFAWCKSNLKVLEAGAAGLAAIASDTHPFNNTLDSNVVTLASTPADWRTAMDAFRQDMGLVRERAQALAEHVREHYQLRDANEIRRQVIESFT